MEVTTATSDGPPVGETFGQRIKGKRRALGLTQRQMAGKLEIDFTYLSKLENDRGEPPGEKTVRKLAVVLQDDAEELMALAGKVPEELRDRAQQDVAFARLLRRLPDVPDTELQEIYRQLEIRPPESARSRMPNQPRPDNPARAVRVPDGLWRAALAKATERGETVSDVIRRALERYVEAK